MMRLRLQERRKSLGYTQESLSARLDIKKQQISNIERGVIGISLAMALEISNLLKYELDPTNKIRTMCNNAELMSLDKVAQIAKQFNVPFDELKLFENEV